MTRSDSTEDLEQREQASQTEQESRPEKLNDRHHKTVYLADAINEEIDDAVSWMQFYASREHDVELEKNRHCYPFVFVVGAERVEEMGIDAVLERMWRTTCSTILRKRSATAVYSISIYGSV